MNREREGKQGEFFPCLSWHIPAINRRGEERDSGGVLCRESSQLASVFRPTATMLPNQHGGIMTQLLASVKQNAFF